MRSWILFETTADDRQQLEDLARDLVAERWCACAQVSGPVTSHFEWEGTQQATQEFVLRGKSSGDLWEQLALRVKRQHPYQVPELIAIPLAAVSADYAAWLASQVRDPQASEP